MKILINLLCAFIPSPTIRHKLRKTLLKKENKIYFSLKQYYNSGKNNKIIIIKDGKRKKLNRFQKIKNLKIHLRGNNNLIEIKFPCQLKGIIKFEDSNNNKISIGDNVSGNISLSLYSDNNIFTLGENTEICQINICLINNECHIGKDCMISSDVIIFGDGHSVLDHKTKKVINLPTTPILIGDHCWLGMQTTFLKGTQIPNDCIVGFKSLVTKPFTEEHCVIAGNPAKVVKKGISWHQFSPTNYKEKIEDKN